MNENNIKEDDIFDENLDKNNEEDNSEDFDLDDIDLEIDLLEDDEILEEGNSDSIEEDVKEEHIEDPNKFKLKHDSIFKGKKYSVEEDDETISSLYIDTFSGLGPDPEIYDSEEEQIRKVELSRLVYEIITLKTDAKLTGSRRKPSRVDFNIYYNCVTINIDNRIYSKTEIFCELSQYFSDNYYSMLKLLQKDWADEIINELQEKYKKFDLRKIDFF